MNQFKSPKASFRERIGSVEVYDSHAPDSVFDPAGGRWVTYCALHGSLVNHKTHALARAFAQEPEAYCQACAALAVTSTLDNPVRPGHQREL